MSACDAVRELLCAHALGALEDAQASLVREHLGECDPCRAAEGDARADVALLEAPPVTPPPQAFARIRARIAAAQAGDEPVRAAEPDAQALIALSCSFCRGALVRADAVYCASCLAPHHPECWREYGRCSVMGCGEPRVVRPSERPEVAPAPVAVVPGDKALDPDRLRRRRSRWLGGGLGLLVGGGLVAAALAPPARLEAPAATLVAPPAPAPAPDPAQASAEPRWDVAVRDASLGELCATLEREAGARIDLSAGLTDVLLREGRWQGRTWREVVVEVARAHGLVVREERDRVGLSGRPAVFELARSTLERRATLLLEVTPRWRLSELRSGPPHEVVVARAGRAVALLEGRSVRVLAPGRDATFTFQAKVERAAWSDGGERLALLEGDRLAVIDLAPAPAVREEARLDEPVTALAWGPNPELGPSVSLASGRVWSRLLAEVDLAPVEGRRVAPLGNGPVLLGERVGAAVRLARIDLPAVTPPGAGMPTVVDGSRWRQVLPPPRWSREVEGDVVELDLPRARALVVSPDGARVLDLATGEDEGEPVRRRGPVFTAHLAPDGARLAWIDDGALFVRRLDGEAADAAVLLPGAAGPISGCAWRGDGRALALWSWQGALGVVDAGDLDRGGAVDASLQLEEPALRRAAWAGDALLLTTATQEVARRPQVRVSPVGTGLDLRLEVDWAPPDPGPSRADLFGRPEPEPPAPPPAPEPEPATPEPDGPAPPPAPAPLPPALAHVRPGQRYTFRGHAGDVRTWDVVDVTPEGVVYTEAVTLRGARMGEPRRETWRLQRPARTEAGPARREARTIGGVTFECLVVEVAGTTRWIAVQGAWAAFPGEVRYVRDGAVMLELVDVR